MIVTHNTPLLSRERNNIRILLWIVSLRLQAYDRLQHTCHLLHLLPCNLTSFCDRPFLDAQSIGFQSSLAAWWGWYAHTLKAFRTIIRNLQRVARMDIYTRPGVDSTPFHWYTLIRLGLVRTSGNSEYDMIAFLQHPVHKQSLDIYCSFSPPSPFGLLLLRSCPCGLVTGNACQSCFRLRLFSLGLLISSPTSPLLIPLALIQLSRFMLSVCTYCTILQLT